jgi:hypothetical protein
MALTNIRVCWGQTVSGFAGFALAILVGLSPHALAQPVGARETAPAPAPKPEHSVSLRWIGAFKIPTGTLFEGVEFGGISGLDRAPNGRYWAISDNRESPRMYALRIDLDQRGLHAVHIEQMVTLRGADGQPLPARTADTEAIRLTADGHLLIASEGHWSVNPGWRHPPFVSSFTTSGSFVRAFGLPPAFGLIDNRTTGARSNKVLESLAVTPGGSVFAAVEGALIDDGPVSTPASGSWLRLIKFDPASGAPAAQYAYALPPIPLPRPSEAGGAMASLASNGLSDLLAVSEDSFIAVERAYVPGQGVTVRLVLTRIGALTTDVSPLPSLSSGTFTPMSRQLLLELAVSAHGQRIDNIEAIAWGPVLANGNRSLVLVSDNNFSRRQTTQFLAWEVVSP